MTQLSGPRPRFWFDPRFIIGLVLVAASIGGVYLLVASTDHTTTVYSTRSALAVGDRIEAGDLVKSQVRLGPASNLYLAPNQLPKTGAVVTRTVSAGELLPVSAVGAAAGLTVTSMVVDLQSKLAATIEPGSVVDVWSGRATGNTEFEPPTVLVNEASIVRIVEASGIISTETGRSVEILVPREKVAAVLESIARGDSLAVVPVNAPLVQ
jgi:hypothetical protein